MSLSQDPPHTLSRGKLLLATAGAVAAGALIVFGAITPAEFNFDPLGLGRLTGIGRLWAPKDAQVDAKGGSIPRAHSYASAWRSDVIEIPLSGFLGGYKNSDLEYKVRMAKDATLIFDWEVIGPADPREFHYDFHGHTLEQTPGAGMTVASYKQGFGLSGHGSLIAPFDGIQGWMFQNSSEKPVIVRVRLSGFYDLIPNGQPGNTSNVTANVPAAQARPELPASLAPTFTANPKSPAT
jgi:hypothetical protein